MAKQKKAVTIRFQPLTYEKLKFIAQSEQRSLTNLVEYLSTQFLQRFETQNGQIKFVGNYQIGDNNAQINFNKK